MDLRYSFEGRTERLIAAGRVVLASFSLLAIGLDPSEPSQYATLAYLLLTAYVFYSLVIALVVWRSYFSLARLGLITHIFDLGNFSLFMYFTEGPTSPFFVYFVFSILCATLRWQWRGTLWTALAALTAFVGMGVYAAQVLQDPAFELNRFIIRAVYLGVLAVLLGYMGAHEFQRRNQLAKLAAWSRTPVFELEKLLTQALERASSILDAPRVLMTWEESEEPWLHVVMLSEGHLQWNRKPPGSFSPLVAGPLEGKSFYSSDVRTLSAVWADADFSQERRWRGEVVNPELAKLFEVRSVLSASVEGENLQGRLFFLDKFSLTLDDLSLAEVVAGQVAASADLFYLLQRLKQMAALEERIRLGRDLHDGVLQSLTVAGLRLTLALQDVKENPDAAREQLHEIQGLLVQEQRDLRMLVEELKPVSAVPREMDFKLGDFLEQLVKALERQWSLRVELKMAGSEAQVPATLAREIYSIIREALINAAHHSQASVARVELGIEDHRVSVAVSDNGHGFPFRGTYELAELTANGAGPVMLKSRIVSLGGSLTIHSAESGARLDITLPLAQPGA